MADGPKKMLWGKEHIDNIGYHDYEEILSDAQAMYDWINGFVKEKLFRAPIYVHFEKMINIQYEKFPG